MSEIKCYDKLDKENALKLEQLISRVNEYDGSDISNLTDGDEFLLSLNERSKLISAAMLYNMGESYEGKDVIEVYILTDPKFRYRGEAGKLLSRIRADNSDKALRFAFYPTDISFSYLEHIGAKWDHDELLMELNLDHFVLINSIPLENKPGLDIDYDLGTAKTKYGECSFKIYRGKAYIYGVLTYESYLRKGYASYLLYCLIREFKNITFVNEPTDKYDILKSCSFNKIKVVYLNVSSLNTPALSLYTKLGFEEKDKVCYYYILSNQGI